MTGRLDTQVGLFDDPEGEWPVERIIAHKGSRTDALFHVLWKSGDLTWLPYDRIEHLSQLEEYFELLGIENIAALRPTRGTAHNSSETFLGSIGVPDSLNNTENLDIYVWTVDGYGSSPTSMSSPLPDPPTAPTPSGSPFEYHNYIAPYHYHDAMQTDEPVVYADVDLSDSPNNSPNDNGEVAIAEPTTASLVDRIAAAPNVTGTHNPTHAPLPSSPPEFYLDVSMMPDINFNRHTDQWEVYDAQTKHTYRLGHYELRDLILISYGLGGDWKHIVPDDVYHGVAAVINARIPKESPYQFAVIGTNGQVIRREKPMKFEHFWTRTEIEKLGSADFNSRNLRELTKQRFPYPKYPQQRTAQAALHNASTSSFSSATPPTFATSSGEAWTQALATSEGQEMVIHGILGLARRSMMHDRSRNDDNRGRFRGRRFRPYGTGNRGRGTRGVEVITPRREQ
ncbi:hypothetical protein PQX77_005163 [Marasmius sp. AFHP31]|nr:hypothetical protein PQX77_005163 [Marasmius sp. AFHP31]